MDLTAAISSLGAGLLVGFPTDTVYGIAADPMRRSGVELLFHAKGRPEVKPIPILAASLADVRKIARLDDGFAEQADHHWPGALTLIVPRASGLPDWIGDPTRDTVGVRIPDHPLAAAILGAFGPLAVTSANRSGQPPTGDERAAEAALGDAISVYLPGVASGGQPSTIVDLTRDHPTVLRQGPIIWSTS